MTDATIGQVVELVVVLASGVASSYAAVKSRKTSKVSRQDELNKVVSLAFGVGKAQVAQPGNRVPLREAVFNAACVIDVQRDGKRDFSDKVLRLAIEAEGHARKLW